jgi:hypothetical protein
MKVFILSFVLVLFSSFSYAGSPSQVPSTSCSKSQNQSSNDKIAQSGCCSHHGGVCGCSGGNEMCCDGAASPSCSCHTNDIEQYLKSNEAEQPKS